VSVSDLVANDRAHHRKILPAACLLIRDHIAGSQTVSSWVRFGGPSTVKYLSKFLGYKTGLFLSWRHLQLSYLCEIKCRTRRCQAQNFRSNFMYLFRKAKEKRQTTQNKKRKTQKNKAAQTAASGNASTTSWPTGNLKCLNTRTPTEHLRQSKRPPIHLYT